MYDGNSNKGTTKSCVEMFTRTIVSIIGVTIEQLQCQIVGVLASALVADIQSCEEEAKQNAP